MLGNRSRLSLHKGDHSHNNLDDYHPSKDDVNIYLVPHALLAHSL